MIEAVFLGTGSGIPTPKRNHASVWIRHERECMLFDCGEGTQRQLITVKLNFMKIDRIFITHWHADHWAGIIGLLLTMNMEDRKRPLYIYGPEADRFVGDILDLGYWGTGFRVIAKPVPYEGDEIEKVYSTRDFVVTSIPVSHSVPSVAYSIKENDRMNVDIKKAEKLYGLKQGPLVGKLKEKGEITFKGKKIRMKDVGYLKRGGKIAYSGDTLPSDNLVKLAENADVLIHDATFRKDEKVEGWLHADSTEAANVAKKAKVKKLILTHFSRRYASAKELEEEAKEIFRNTVAAKDFMQISV
jgi:ribonuclease Z